MNDLDRRQQLRHKLEKAEDGLYRFIEFGGRAALVAVGLMITILAGFLSQVWGSGGVAFRTELAGLLRQSGSLFVITLPVPMIGFMVQALGNHWPRLSMLTMLVWAGLLVVVIFWFGSIVSSAAETILHFAKLPTP